jgi:thiosulfate/3-mercaptopyruvate sulfurtransferase
MDDLVSTHWLAERLGEPGLVVLDATAHVLDPQRNAREEFAGSHIPGARFLDLTSLTDPDSPVPAALPSAAQFAERMEQLGVHQGDRLVLYDDTPARTSARAWFIARMYGVGVAILDGGLGKWRGEGRPVESGASAPPRARFSSAPGMGAVRTNADVLANIATREEQLLDARGAGRFSGQEPEPRPDLPSGHIPGSRNLPYARVLNEDGTFKEPEALRGAFEAAGIDLRQPVVTTCGSGVTAAVLLFALHLLGKEDVALYDGSWSEWAADPATPKATGAAA